MALDVIPGVTSGTFLLLRGILKSQTSTLYDFGLLVVGNARLYIAGELVVDNWNKITKSGHFFGMGTAEERGCMFVEAGKEYVVEMHFKSAGADAGFAAGSGAFRLGGCPRIPETEELERAVTLAAEADIAIVIVGLNHELESEGV